MKSLKLAVAAMLAGLVLTAAPASAQTLDRVKERGKLVVGIHGDFPPFGYVTSRGEQEGYDSELARRFAAELNVPVEFVTLDNAARIPALTTGRVDILFAALTILPERAKAVQFSIPYVASESTVIGVKSLKATGPEDLTGVRVGVPKGSAQDFALSKGSKANILRFEGDAATIQSLISGQTEAIGQSLFTLPRLEELKPGAYDRKFTLSVIYNGIGTLLGDKEVNARLNTFIEKLKASGELQRIHQKWMKLPLPELPTTIEGVSFTSK